MRATQPTHAGRRVVIAVVTAAVLTSAAGVSAVMFAGVQPNPHTPLTTTPATAEETVANFSGVDAALLARAAAAVSYDPSGFDAAIAASVSGLPSATPEGPTGEISLPVPAPEPLPVPEAPVAVPAPEPAPVSSPPAPALSGLARADAAMRQAVPAHWLNAVSPQLASIPGPTSWAHTHGTISVGTYHSDRASWGRLQSVMAHEVGHLIAFRYGTGDYLGAPPAGWPGPRDPEVFAECVAVAWGVPHGSGPCPSDALNWTANFLVSGPPA